MIDSGGFYGAEVMLLELVKEQRILGIDAQVLSIGAPSIKEKDIEKELKINGIPVYVVRMLPGPNLVGALRILQYAKKNNFNILHSHGYKSNILLAIFPKWFRSIPLVTTLHGWTATKINSKIYFYEYIDRALLKKMDFVVSVTKKNLDKKGIDINKIKNFKVIENGISSEIPRNDNNNYIINKLYDLKKEGYVIGSIGRLSYEKGYDILLKTFAELIKGRIPDYRLVIFGDGRLRKELLALSKQLDISEYVHFLGYQKNAGQYMALMDIYVNASRSEGMPITILEAMRIGCPIVATEVGGVSNLLNYGEFGSLVKPNDILGLKKEIIKTLSDENTKKIESAKLYFNNFFSSKVMARNYLDLYIKLLPSRSSELSRM